MRTSRKLIASIATLFASLFLTGVNGWFALGFVLTLPLAILYWFDYGRELRELQSPTRARRLLGTVMGVPQALFGLVSLITGLTLVVWVLYNSLWARDPNYTGGFMTFGIGPLLVLFGLGFIADAFRKSPPSSRS